MSLRLALLPSWVRFVVLAVWFGVGVGVGTELGSERPGSTIVGAVVCSLAAGVGFAALSWYRARVQDAARTEAVAGLSKADKRQAIAAVLYGVVPADPVVRSSALQFGQAYLGFQSDDQLRRRERQNWWLMSLLVAAVIAGAIVEHSLAVKLFFVALGSLVLVALPVGISRTQLIRRNIVLISDFEMSG